VVQAEARNDDIGPADIIFPFAAKADMLRDSDRRLKSSGEGFISAASQTVASTVVLSQWRDRPIRAGQRVPGEVPAHERSVARADRRDTVGRSGVGRTARVWGVFAGLAFAIATAAFVLEAAGLLASSPAYTPTAAGQLTDEAKFFVASFAYQQRVLWDFVLRDALFFFAFLALIPLGIGLREVAGRGRVAPQLAAAFLAVAAIFGCLNAYSTFVQVDYWKSSGWDTVPATIMVAVGRQLDLMSELSRWSGIASYAALATALYYLARACRSSAVLPGWLGVVAYVGAAILVAMIVVSQVDGTDALNNLLSLAIGMVVAPLVTIGLGVYIARAASVASAPADLRSA